jgi:hypothetical protein
MQIPKDGNAPDSWNNPVKFDAMCMYRSGIYVFLGKEWFKLSLWSGDFTIQHVNSIELHNKLCEASGVGELWSDEKVKEALKKLETK